MPELPRIDIPNIKEQKIDDYRNIKPEGAQTLKETNDFWNKEFEQRDIGDKSAEIKEAAKEYINDLKEKSEYADTIDDSVLDVSKFERQSPEKIAEMREEYDENKAKLRKEWETINNREWPRYKEDVYNENGVRIRKAGDCYDGHHIQPLCMGGLNEAKNLTPLALDKHSEIHTEGGTCSKLIEKFEGSDK